MADKSFRDYSYAALVVEADPSHYDHDEVVYEFSNARKFKIDDHDQRGGKGGVYSIADDNAVYWDGDLEAIDWDDDTGEVLWD